MKRALPLLLLAGLAPAADLEGTVWYDSKGKVAWVEGPAAKEKKSPPFTPHWVAYEQRRDRALRGGAWRHRARGDSGWPVWSDSVGLGWYGGTSCHAALPAGRCAAPAAGARVIIR